MKKSNRIFVVGPQVPKDFFKETRTDEDSIKYVEGLEKEVDKYRRLYGPSDLYDHAFKESSKGTEDILSGCYVETVILPNVEPSDEYKEALKNLDNPSFFEAKPIRTQTELDNERLSEIVEGIVRYSKQKMAIPTEWIEEYNTIIERERNKPNI